MPSPFPGMDPYLEDDALWTAFHHQFIACLYENLLPGLSDRYRAGVKQRIYSIGEEQSGSAMRRELSEDYIEIHQRSDGRLISLMDMVSPANKLTAIGRAAYLDTRREAKDTKANLVEIDLVLQGQPTLDYSREGLPEGDYAITVTRSTQPERFEIYTATLQKRLPRFRLPLASDDRDTVLDLPAAFNRCFDEGGFAAHIDYIRDPPTVLKQENRQWLEQMLQQQRLRPTHDEIARTAYLLWQQEECPHGRDREHWHGAIEQWKQQARSNPAEA